MTSKFISETVDTPGAHNAWSVALNASLHTIERELRIFSQFHVPRRCVPPSGVSESPVWPSNHGRDGRAAPGDQGSSITTCPCPLRPPGDRRPPPRGDCCQLSRGPGGNGLRERDRGSM